VVEVAAGPYPVAQFPARVTSPGSAINGGEEADLDLLLTKHRSAAPWSLPPRQHLCATRTPKGPPRPHRTSTFLL